MEKSNIPSSLVGFSPSLGCKVWRVPLPPSPRLPTKKPLANSTPTQIEQVKKKSRRGGGEQGGRREEGGGGESIRFPPTTGSHVEESFTYFFSYPMPIFVSWMYTTYLARMLTHTPSSNREEMGP